MSRVDYCVTTMERPQALERLLLSIATHRPEASVHVADQSEGFDPHHYAGLRERMRQAGLRRPLTLHRLPFDCGVSAACNHLMDSTPSEYKLSLDDDFVFTERTDIDAMVRLLDASPGVGLVGGAVTHRGAVRHGGTRFERRGDSLHQLPLRGPDAEVTGLRVMQADCVPLFVLMRAELFSHLRWDADLKTGGQHFDFFLRLQQTPYTVLYAPEISIEHPPIEADPAYMKLRRRGEFLQRMLRKHGLRRLKRLNGTIFALREDGELTMYCELTTDS